MTPDIQAKWTTALRSGQYKQVFDRLGKVKPGDGACYRCAMGVLAEVINAPTLVDGNNIVILTEVGYDKIQTVCDSAMRYAIIDMNDNKCLSFNEIANWLDNKV